jgi:hypothetical protein
MLARVMVSAMVALALGQGVFAGCTCSMPAGGCGGVGIQARSFSWVR